MLDWHTQILPLILGPPILIGIFVLWYVVPVWISSFDQEKK